MEKIYRDDFNFVESSKNGDLIKISEINKMIEYGAVSINREKLEDYKKTMREKKVSVDELIQNDKQGNKKIHKIIKEILIDNGYKNIDWDDNLQIICKDNNGKLIGLIYSNLFKCRLFQLMYSNSKDPMAFDYDSLLRYVENINKNEDYWYVKYLYPIDDIHKRIKDMSKHTTTIEIITDNAIFNKILNGIAEKREYILG